MSVLLIAVVKSVLLSRPPIVTIIVVARAPINRLTTPPIIVSILRVLIVHHSVEGALSALHSSFSRSCEEHSEIVVRRKPAYTSS
jgi:hypothetical protein